MARGPKRWIQGAIRHPGSLRRSLHVPEDERIPRGKLLLAARRGGKIGKRARLAVTLGRLGRRSS